MHPHRALEAPTQHTVWVRASAMSWELQVDTNDMRALRGRHQTTSMFRMEEARPFDPGAFGWQARAQVRPVIQEIGTRQEKMGLIERPRQRESLSLSTSITLCAAVSLWFLVVATIGVMYYNVASSVAQARDSARPFILEAVNHTMSILMHADNSMVGTNTMVDGAASITNQAVPALQLAMNQTAAMISRLEALAEHPVLQLSLTQGQVTPAGGR